MNSEFNELEKMLNIFITEEIDHHTTEKLRRKMDYEITRFMPRKVVFDFSKVSFMDSAGIGLLIGRYKLVKLIGGSCEITHCMQSISKVLEKLEPIMLSEIVLKMLDLIRLFPTMTYYLRMDLLN